MEETAVAARTLASMDEMLDLLEAHVHTLASLAHEIDCEIEGPHPSAQANSDEPDRPAGARRRLDAVAQRLEEVTVQLARTHGSLTSKHEPKGDPHLPPGSIQYVPA